jgi:hypothetical protein
VFEWNLSAAVVIEDLKRAITTSLALVLVEYGEPLKEVIILVDGSKKG